MAEGSEDERTVSPKRKLARDKAATAQAKQAKRMMERATKVAGGEVCVGSVVQVAVADVDRAKTDETNATLVVVELVKKPHEIFYRLACAAGQIKDLYTRSYINPINVTPLAMGLQGALNSWHELPAIPLRSAMQVVSAVGGQGMVRCSCSGPCNTNRCSCFKANRKCNSRCHKSSVKCANHD